jgi:hypothetical protein
LIFAIPNGEYPAGASGSPYVRATRATGEPTLDISALPGLIGEFTTFVPSANRGAGDAVPIKKAPIDVIKVVLKAFMASSSRPAIQKSDIAVGPDSAFELRLSFKPSTQRREKRAHNGIGLGLLRVVRFTET